MSKNPKNNIKNALCYMPLVAIILLLIEEKKDDELRKHIKYAIILFAIYFFLTLFFTLFFFKLAFIMNWLIILIYFILSWVLWYKAYKWDEVQVEVLDDFENKVKDTFK